jgi:diguanylate cyclase (GGDEF)-like protein
MNEKPLVLVVDDDRGTRLIMKKALQQAGINVVEADNGLAAVNTFESHRPDLILLDVFMPEMDGFEACRKIRSLPQGVTVPVIMITTSDDFKAIGEAYAAGATDFFVKPINRRILSERVRYMLRASATANQLRKSEELQARAQAIAGMGSFFYDPASSQLKASKEFKLRFGPSESNQHVTWEDFWQRVHPDDQKNLQPFLTTVYKRGACFSRDIRFADGKAGERFVMLQIDPETDSDGNINRLVGIVQDITERKLSELFEKDQSHVMRLIVRKEPLKEIFLEACRLLERQRPKGLAGICRIEENKIDSLVSASLPNSFLQAMSQTDLSIHNGTWSAAAYFGEPIVTKHVFLNPFWKNKQKIARDHGLCSSAAVPVFSGTGRVLGTVGMMSRDPYHVSNADLELLERVANLVALAIEQEHLSRKLIHQARHDPLTGLVNRATLMHWMPQVLKQSTRKTSLGAYMILDLDRFKHVNDCLGHHMGDLLLKEVAKRLQHSLRESDVLSRVGGDEFVVVLPEIENEEDAVTAASRIIDVLKSPFFMEGQRLSIEASIGITLFPQDATDGTELHKNADIAMYVAKNEGGNRFHFFNNEMHEAVLLRLQIQNDLRKALDRNEFELYYQPQIDLNSNTPTVMEALIRWNHPEQGRIMPDRFIPVAEESRLIIPIGRWVLKEACRQNKRWQEEGFSPVRVAVNISAVQFAETDFAGMVEEALEETGLAPRWLEVEITETVLLKNLKKAGENLRKLKKLGVTTTLDDFGTGYSSITYLKDLPLDGIKVDRSFIRDMKISPVRNDCKNTSFVRAFAAMAQNLHLHLVAEGVETIEQRLLLKRMGYTIGQGFLFSAPLPAKKVSKFLLQTSKRQCHTPGTTVLADHCPVGHGK